MTEVDRRWLNAYINSEKLMAFESVHEEVVERLKIVDNLSAILECAAERWSNQEVRDRSGWTPRMQTIEDGWFESQVPSHGFFMPDEFNAVPGEVALLLVINRAFRSDLRLLLDTLKEAEERQQEMHKKAYYAEVTKSGG